MIFSIDFENPMVNSGGFFLLEALQMKGFSHV
jgi:hypothetical protein